MTIRTKCDLPTGSLVLDEWYGLGIILSIDDGKSNSGYRYTVKFFFGNKPKENHYNDREINDLHQNYLLATVKGKKYYADNIEGRFNNGNRR